MKRMERALAEMRIVGVTTTVPFARFVMTNKKFQNGEFSTKFVAEEFTSEVSEKLHQDYIDKNADALLSVQAFLNKQKERKFFVGMQ